MNSYVYHSAQVGNASAESVNLWSVDRGARYRQAADEAIEQITAMLKLDLASSASDPANLPQTSLDGSTMVPALHQQPGRAIVRLANGKLYSIPQ